MDVFVFSLHNYDFLTDNSVGSVLNALATIYIGALAIYVSNKEFERWYHRHRGQHPGEIFVLIWSALVFVLIIGDLAWENNYELPNAVISSYIAVLTILAVTKKSKQMYLARQVKSKVRR